MHFLHHFAILNSHPPPQKEKFIPKFLTLNMLRQMKKKERKWNFVENIDSLSSITDMQKNKLQKKPNYFF